MRLMQRIGIGVVVTLLSGMTLGASQAPATTLAAPTLAGVPTGRVATWSVQVNTPDWNTALGVAATRQGCSDPPPTCVGFVGKVAQTSSVRVSLAVPLNATTTVDNASQYSQLSLSAPFLVEVGVDDFVDQYKALFSNTSQQPASLLNNVIANLKSANPTLKFGATIYEDELASPYLQDARLPSSIRDQFDYVHLFIHYRQDGLQFASGVQQAEQLFPNAHVIAGSYAYDRRAYLPCSPGGQPCSTQQELDLFSQTITLQAQLLSSGDVDSIEFYPGYFGTEDQWPGWSNPRECAPGDLAACIANTKSMRQTALAALAGGSPTSGAGTNQLVTTVAGNGGGGYSGDNGPATSAQISAPSGVAVDPTGNVYVVDAGNWVIRKIDTRGIVHAFAGSGTDDNKCGEGVPTTVGLDAPIGVATDSAGNVYIADTLCAMVFKVDSAGKLMTGVAGGVDANLSGDGGLATNTQLVAPSGIAVDRGGTLYIADAGTNTVRAVDRVGIIHTLAGNGAAEYTGDEGPATAAALSAPQGVAIDLAGNVYIADTGNNVVRRVDASGNIHTFAGTDTPGYAGDEGSATGAQLLSPTGVAADSYGDMYIADTGNNVIRQVDTSGVIHTIVGDGTGGFAGDGGTATAGELAQPAGIAEIDAGPSVAGRSEYGSIRVFVADTVNNRVREVFTPDYMVGAGR
jgi:sugar lactone lactonase YvrE